MHQYQLFGYLFFNNIEMNVSNLKSFREKSNFVFWKNLYIWQNFYTTAGRDRRGKSQPFVHVFSIWEQ